MVTRVSMPRSSRLLAGATGIATLVVLVVYLAVLRAQNDAAGPGRSGPAWWFVGVLGVVVALSGGAAAVGRVRAAMIVCAVLLAGCVLAGLLSIGLLLVPATVTAVLSAVLGGPRSRTVAPSSGAVGPPRAL